MQSKNYLKLKLKPGSTAATTHAEWSGKATTWQILRSSSLLLVRTFFGLLRAFYSFFTLVGENLFWAFESFYSFFTLVGENLFFFPNHGNCGFKSDSLKTFIPIHEYG